MNPRLAQVLDTEFRTHNRDALRLATRLVGTPERGEDVVMSVWLRLVALIGRAPPSAQALPENLIARPRGYLLRAVRNMAVDHLEQMRRESRYRVALEDLDALPGAASSAEEALHRRRRIAVLAVAINALPGDCRRAFVQSRLHGRPYREIAAELGVSVSMVEKHILRALKACRSGLEEAGY